jgi:c-di-GMP-related signal transduction protein
MNAPVAHVFGILAPPGFCHFILNIKVDNPDKEHRYFSIIDFIVCRPKKLKYYNNINTSPPELTKVIKLDPVLSAKVLKLVNSSYFALNNEIVSA